MFTQNLFQGLLLCLHSCSVKTYNNTTFERMYRPQLLQKRPAVSKVENARYLRKSQRSIVCHALCGLSIELCCSAHLWVIFSWAMNGLLTMKRIQTKILFQLSGIKWSASHFRSLSKYQITRLTRLGTIFCSLGIRVLALDGNIRLFGHESLYIFVRYWIIFLERKTTPWKVSVKMVKIDQRKET